MILRWFQLPLLLLVSLLFFTYHIRCVSVAKSLYFKTFSAPCLITFISHYYYYYYYPCYHLYAIIYLKQSMFLRCNSVAAVLYLQFVLDVMLFPPLNKCYTFTLAAEIAQSI
jgi:hypothetical protein